MSGWDVLSFSNCPRLQVLAVFAAGLMGDRLYRRGCDLKLWPEGWDEVIRELPGMFGPGIFGQRAAGSQALGQGTGFGPATECAGLNLSSVCGRT